VATRLILIVDDEAPLRDFLAVVLEDLGHRVLGAINGLHALALAAGEEPDLVISDVMMPVMGGLELTRRLKAGEAGDAAVPVILMSAAGPRSTETAGADAYIDKPFELASIEALVARLLA
jgi:CheY-like chemotaxis protein